MVRLAHFGENPKMIASAAPASEGVAKKKQKKKHAGGGLFGELM